MTRPSSDRLELVLLSVLRWGARVSTALLAIGLALELTGAAPAVANPITRLGLIVLMATPVARVVVSVFEYLAERDWMFAALTATVLTILVGSLLVALQ